jgi:nucleotide-binding universal stress UspA family protein
MFENFLVPLDTSEMSEQVLPYVELLAGRLGEPVHLLTVADDGQLMQIAPHNVTIAEIVEERRISVSGYLKDVRERLEASGVTVTTEMATGHVADTILNTASRRSSGLIAMATHGRVGPERWFLGSVADRIARSATAPVLLVRPGKDPASAAASIQRVILPLDGSTLAEAAIPQATFLARTFSSPIVLVRTLDLTWLATGDGTTGDFVLTPDLQELLESDATEYLATTAAGLEDNGLKVERVFSFQLPASEIIEQAHAAPGALIVMSSHGRSGLGRTVLGSVADRVMRTAEAPVLLVRGAAQ